MASELPGNIALFEEESDNGLVVAVAGAISDSDNQDFDNPSDLDLVNILYVDRLPLVPDAEREALTQVTEDLKLWEQWEMTRIESMVQDKVKSGDLPKDSTVEAKSKRTLYRTKVQRYFRNNAPWLGVRNEKVMTHSVKASSKQINLEVLHLLLTTSPLPQDVQFTILLKAVGLGFDGANSMVRPFSLSVVDYNYDSAPSSFRPQLTTLSFDVDVQTVPKTEKDPQSTATLTYTTQVADFNLGLWASSKPPPSQVQLGASILPQKQLTLLQVNT